MIIIRQRSFSQDNNKEGMSTGKKIALGATLAAGAAFAGARRGMLGTNALKMTNTWTAKAGNTLAQSSNSFIKSAGDRMLDNSIKNVGQAAKKAAVQEFAQKKGLETARDIVKAGGNDIGKAAQKSAEVGFIKDLLRKK